MEPSYFVQNRSRRRKANDGNAVLAIAPVSRLNSYNVPFADAAGLEKRTLRNVMPHLYEFEFVIFSEIGSMMGYGNPLSE